MPLHSLMGLLLWKGPSRSAKRSRKNPRDNGGMTALAAERVREDTVAGADPEVLDGDNLGNHSP
jgi:hypothetical protein